MLRFLIVEVSVIVGSTLVPCRGYIIACSEASKLLQLQPLHRHPNEKNNKKNNNNGQLRESIEPYGAGIVGEEEKCKHSIWMWLAKCNSVLQPKRVAY